MTDARTNLISWLRDAHAMEEQAETMLKAQFERIENYPELKARIGQHLEETRGQAEALRACLERMGESSSSLKDAAGKLAAMAQGMGGMFTSDEVVKGSMASYTFEHMEIASYRVLIAAAETVGDIDTADMCRGILEQEIAMADWLADNLPAVTRQFLLRDDTDLTAKR
ncbi:MAG: ferritin-like domain-containing protein [Allorhizobium sp.]